MKKMHVSSKNWADLNNPKMNCFLNFIRSKYMK